MITRNVIIRLLQHIVLFCITLAIARFTGPAGNGIFSLFITEASLLILLLGLSADSAILYFTAKKKLGLSGLVSIAIPLIIMQVLLCISFYYLSVKVFDYPLFKTGISQPSLLWGGVFIISNIFFNYFYAYLAAQKRYFGVVAVNTAVQFLFLVLLVILYMHPKNTYAYLYTTETLIPTYTVLFLVQAVITIFFVARQRAEKIKLVSPLSLMNKEFVVYTTVVYAGNVLQFLAYRMDVWILDYYHSKEELGLYAMAAKIAQLFWLLPQLVSSMLFPLTALEHDDVKEDKFTRLVKFTFIGTVAAALLAGLLYPFFINIVLGDAYEKSYTYFLWLLPGIVLFTAAIMLAARLAGKGKVKTNMQASAICFVVVLLLDLLLIPSMAGKGAAIATTIGYTLTSAYIYMSYYRWIK